MKKIIYIIRPMNDNKKWKIDFTEDVFIKLKEAKEYINHLIDKERWKIVKGVIEF